MTSHATRMPAAERREQLLDATRRVVARGGYTELTMEAIAREAGVTKPVVYSAFANRDDVMTCLLQVEGARVVADIGHAIQKAAQDAIHGAFGEMVTLALERVLQLVLDHPHRYRLILLRVDGAPCEVREAIGEGRRILTARIATIVSTAPLPAGADADLLATLLVGIGEHAATLALTEPDLTPKRLAHSVGELLCLSATSTLSHQSRTSSIRPDHHPGQRVRGAP